MTYRTLFIKIHNEVSPCDDCPSKVKCKYHELACQEFKQYIATGKLRGLQREPNELLYHRLYKEDIRL